MIGLLGDSLLSQTAMAVFGPLSWQDNAAIGVFGATNQNLRSSSDRIDAMSKSFNSHLGDIIDIDNLYTSQQTIDLIHTDTNESNDNISKFLVYQKAHDGGHDLIAPAMKNDIIPDSLKMPLYIGVGIVGLYFISQIIHDLPKGRK
jgi:hypothetical protein